MLYVKLKVSLRAFYDRRIMADLIRHTGEVISQEGDRVQVRIEQQSACTACRAKGFCTSADAQVKVLDCQANGEHYTAGEKVEVQVEENLGMKAVLLAYVLPFLVIIMTLSVLSHFLTDEATVGIVALAAAALYFLILTLAKNKLKQTFNFHLHRIEKED